MGALAELFPDGDYRFHLTLRRGEPRAFFAREDASGAVLAERARWLAADPPRYAALRPEGEPLLAEVVEMSRAWGAAVADSMAALGAALEPDVLLLSRDEAGQFRLRGGALCFPTGWALEDKLGHTVDFIHGVVPGLNAALASPIHQFLARLKPGTAFHRDNWGLAATDELNLHPARALPAPGLPLRLDRLWLRIEHQALVALPRTGGVLFGIRIALHRLDTVAVDRAAAAGLRRALATMPAELAAYKRVDAIRSSLVDALA
ncbi:MAG TPA: heme-dependent oxidative N-demethylase subunit alpha family protein [Opitutus sp.]|nr:heme-dependent oxidative N-demethylase subunit alpha family protein [Opitutus sp.]